MKRNFNFTSALFLSATMIAMVSCSGDPYRPGKFLSENEQAQLIRETVYYTAKLAPTASHETKFDKQFKEYYDLAADETNVMKYFVAKDSTQYFLLSRRARSITPMREGIGGRLTRDASGKIVSYAEIFRTWKMPEDTLKVRGAFLFDRMIKGKDLTMYYSKFQADRYIEFPDARYSFDETTRRWHDSAKDSLKVE